MYIFYSFHTHLSETSRPSLTTAGAPKVSRDPRHQIISQGWEWITLGYGGATIEEEPRVRSQEEPDQGGAVSEEPEAKM